MAKQDQPPAATSPEAAAQSPGAPDASVTQLLLSWSGGNIASADALLPVIYAELHQMAERAMRREAPEHTLQATALVHEAYLRLIDQRQVDWKNRSHFFGIAAQAMRRVLVDHARARLAAKRGGEFQQITLSGIAQGSAENEADAEVGALELHEALERLTALDPDQAKVVELRYFAGLTIEETAEALGISPATVKREWATARAWLKRELTTL